MDEHEVSVSEIFRQGVKEGVLEFLEENELSEVMLSVFREAVAEKLAEIEDSIREGLSRILSPRRLS